jgi:hypothetical protein
MFPYRQIVSCKYITKVGKMQANGPSPDKPEIPDHIDAIPRPQPLRAIANTSLPLIGKASESPALSPNLSLRVHPDNSLVSTTVGAIGSRSNLNLNKLFLRVHPNEVGSRSTAVERTGESFSPLVLT